jgi:hypothetical protein
MSPLFGHVRRWLGPYCEGALPPAQAARVAAHVLACRRCRRKLEEVRAGVRLARALVPAAVPAALGEATAGRSAWSSWSSASPAANAAAAAAVDWSELAPLLDPRPSRPSAPARARWTLPVIAAASAAAAAALVVVGARVTFGPASLERAALSAHRAASFLPLGAEDRGALERWTEARVGAGALLPPAAQIVGATELPAGHGGAARAVAVACRLDDQPVTLVIGEGAGATAPKRVAHRRDGDLRVATWTQDGRSYALVSPLRLRGDEQAACTLCHERAGSSIVTRVPRTVL